MKVLEEGKSPTWSIEQKCTGEGNGGGGCGAKLLVEISDVYWTEEFEREGNGAKHLTFTCVRCKAQTDIAKKHWPQHHILESVGLRRRPSTNNGDK